MRLSSIADELQRISARDRDRRPMLILDYECWRAAAEADAIADVTDVLGLTSPPHVLAYTFFTQMAARLRTDVPRFAEILGRADLICITELSPYDADCVRTWSQHIVPRSGPQAGSNSDAACALAYAQSRAAVAVLADLDMVETAQTLDPSTRAVWLPDLIDSLAADASDVDSSLLIKRLVDDGAAPWSPAHLASLDGFDD